MTTPRAHAVGSMLRSPQLKRARSRWLAGSLPAADFKKLEDAAVRECLAVQERAGIDVLSDGEVRRYTFVAPLTEAVRGIGLGRGSTLEWHLDDGTIDEIYSPMVVRDRLRRRRSSVVEEFVYLRSRTERPVKVTLPSPFMLAFMWSPQESPQAYPDPFELFSDGAAFLRQDIAELVELGCTRIQIDAPDLGVFGTEEEYARRFAERSGLPVERMLAEAADLLSMLVAGFEGVTFGLHICRGNGEGRWMAWGGYERLVRDVLHRLEGFDQLLLEYDTERAGTFEPLAKLPHSMQVVLGLVSTKNRAFEFPSAVKARIAEAARYFPLDQLALSPQCGFASVMEGNDLDAATQEAKLRLVGRIARDVWG